VIAGAGCVLLDWGPSRGTSTSLRARIVNVFTAPQWRRRGIARKLVSDVIGECEQLDIRNFSLAATADADGLYRALGFVRQESELVLRR
jgi:GNAT superfamily N-acetyltransferase